MPLSLRLPLTLSLTLLPPALAAQEHDHAYGAELRAPSPPMRGRNLAWRKSWTSRA